MKNLILLILLFISNLIIDHPIRGLWYNDSLVVTYENYKKEDADKYLQKMRYLDSIKYPIIYQDSYWSDKSNSHYPKINHHQYPNIDTNYNQKAAINTLASICLIIIVMYFIIVIAIVW